MKNPYSSNRRGFTLLETVIAIGVLAVLLSGFMVVFTPAADGIRKSINVQQADRLTTTVEQELGFMRPNDKASDVTNGFDKAFKWMTGSNVADNSLLIYQYRGDVKNPRSDDGTPTPVKNVANKLPGEDYVTVSMMRRKSDQKLSDDLAAVEGPVYFVKCTQLVLSGTEMKLGVFGKIVDPKGGPESPSPNDYPEAVIAFAADFYQMPSSSPGFFSSSAFTDKFTAITKPNSTVKPLFSRNLAVRR